MRSSRVSGRWIVRLGALALAAGSCVALARTLPSRENMLAWTPAEQLYGYSHIEKIYTTHVVRRGTRVHPLPVSPAPLDVSYTFEAEHGSVKDYMERNHISGLLVIKRGRIVLERYAQGMGPHDRWTSFSVGKSVTSTLLGAAVKDGYIKSLSDPVTRYIPELKDTAYDGVTLEQVLEMRSGVKWNENYEDPKSDVWRLTNDVAHDADSLVAQMAALPREAPPGSRWVYKTGESNLIGVVVLRATGKPLATYLSEKIWAPFGMERDALWSTTGGKEIGGCCISMTLKDYGRFALFFMANGKVGSTEVLPTGWNTQATTPYSQNVFGDRGYAYQWWVHDERAFEAIGIFGQNVVVDPSHELVLVTLSAWPKASWKEGYGRTSAFLGAVRQATDSQ